MPLPSSSDVVVIGAGWAGLAASWRLRQAGVDHVILEKGRVGETWRTQRWDSFLMNLPNFAALMPGKRYTGDEPDGFLNRDEFVIQLEHYVARNRLPLLTKVHVTELLGGPGGFRIVSSEGETQAQAVVVATGSLNKPVRPSFSPDVPSRILQMDASEYRNPDQLRHGAVLVVGAAQSGGQIAEELAWAGRETYLSTGRVGRMRRSYRGRDIVYWLLRCGLFDVPRSDFLDPLGRGLAGRPLLGAGHTISLQSLSHAGVRLLGRVTGSEGPGVLTIADDLVSNIAFANESSRGFIELIERYIAQAGVVAPPAEPETAEDCEPIIDDPPILSFELQAHDVSAVIWCTGFRGDYGWIKVNGCLDRSGQPLQDNCVSPIPGLLFAGIDFGSTRRSGTMLAAEQESARIANEIIRVLGSARR
ncbi:flavin-containing monooxygenase [Alsobacter sp. SYSU BS001988]